MKSATELAQEGRVGEAFDTILAREVPASELALPPEELAKRGLVKEAYERVLTGDEGKVASAEKAFESELLPWLANEVQAMLKDKLDKKMLAIQKGQWPDSRLEYAVTRYRALDQTQEQFLKDVVGYYLAWRRDLRRLIQK
jgi:hypothetical protein